VDDVGVDAEELERRFEAAVHEWRVADESGDDDLAWQRLRFAAEAGPPAAETALGKLSSPDPAARATACDLLRVVCEQFEPPREATVVALLDLAREETDPDVQVSIAYAFGATNDARGIPVLVDLARHPDPDVRLAAARSLPATMLVSVELQGVRALIELTGDTDDDVRNWATFGLGRQIDADNPEIRTALWARVDDAHTETREEAIAGLARRREPRALPLVLGLLESGEVPTWIFEAAAYLADPSLVEILRTYGEDDPPVARALAFCDPVEKARVDRAHAELLVEIQRRLTERFPGAHATLERDLLELDVTLCVTFADGEETAGGPDGILAARDGDAAAAADRWVELLEQQRR
jgi:hypothetical protein